VERHYFSIPRTFDNLNKEKILIKVFLKGKHNK